MSRLSIVFAGSGAFGLPALSGLMSAGHRVIRVVSQPDRPAGRGRKLTPTPVAAFAAEHDLPRGDQITDADLAAADALVVIAFAQKIPQAVADRPRLGAVNLHASRLPRYRGAAPIAWAILQGETVTGNSIIRLAPVMDAGAVLAQSTVDIGETQTAGELHDRLADDGEKLLLGVLEQLDRGTAQERAQDESSATRAPKLDRHAAMLDWRQPAQQVARQIRALYPWPGCRVALIDAQGAPRARAILVRARPAAAADPLPPGTIDARACIAAGDGAVEIMEIQPEGKRPMPLADYQNGHPWTTGWRVQSVE